MVQATKIIGTGLATTGSFGAGVGIGVVFGALKLGVARNPRSRGQSYSCVKQFSSTAKFLAADPDDGRTITERRDQGELSITCEPTKAFCKHEKVSRHVAEQGDIPIDCDVCGTNDATKDTGICFTCNNCCNIYCMGCMVEHDKVDDTDKYYKVTTDNTPQKTLDDLKKREELKSKEFKQEELDEVMRNKPIESSDHMEASYMQGFLQQYAENWKEMYEQEDKKVFEEQAVNKEVKKLGENNSEEAQRSEEAKVETGNPEGDTSEHSSSVDESSLLPLIITESSFPIVRLVTILYIMYKNSIFGPFYKHLLINILYKKYKNPMFKLFFIIFILFFIGSFIWVYIL
jgi:hypothetical protein